MNSSFDLLAAYNGKNLTFPSELLVTGYGYKIIVDVNGTEVTFERDDDSNLRAIVDPEKINGKDLTVDLLKSISEAIETMGEQLQ